MKKLLQKTFFLSPIIFLSCASENRLEFCECMDLKKAFVDQYNLSKNEIKEKEKGCLWIENELSPVEITQKTLECWNVNSTQSDTISNVSSDSIYYNESTNYINNIPKRGKAKCKSEIAYIYSNPDMNSKTDIYYEINDVILYVYNSEDNTFIEVYSENKSFIGYGLISDFSSFEEDYFITYKDL